MATPNYDINYDDKRFTQVESDKSAAITDIENTYDGMISESDTYFQNQIDAVEDWGEKQTEIQNEQTEFAIDKIEQQQKWAEKDYQKEQSGAYVDWQKQSNKYGANAEQMAAQGMADTGYSESAQVAMYNQYQNRVAMARESFVRAQTEFANAMTEARLQNSAALAQIAAETLQKKLDISLQGFQYKNQLIDNKTTKKLEVDNMYYNRWKDVLAQINQENALAEDARQYNESLAEERRQYNNTMAFNREQFNWQKAQANKSSGGGGSSGGSSGGSGSGRQPIFDKTPVNKNNNSNDEKITDEKITVDMDSVAALGYGASISEKELSELVLKGLVTMYVEDGKYKFKRTPHIVERGVYTRFGHGGNAKDIHTRK